MLIAEQLMKMALTQLLVERLITVQDLLTGCGGGTILFRGKVIWLQSERRGREGGWEGEEGDFGRPAGFYRARLKGSPQVW